MRKLSMISAYTNLQMDWNKMNITWYGIINRPSKPNIIRLYISNSVKFGGSFENV